MYNPRHFQMNDAAMAAKLIAENPLSTLIGPDAQGRSFATHVPLTLIEEGEGAWQLEGHMARANPHWEWLNAQSEVLAVFTGPDAYISPSFYDTKLAVPTWNYLAVHAYGTLEIIDEPEAKDALLKRLIAKHDEPYIEQWNNDLPEDFKSKLLGAIVGFRLRVTRWEGKAKISQNRAATERERLMAEASPEMRCWMEIFT